MSTGQLARQPSHTSSNASKPPTRDFATSSQTGSHANSRRSNNISRGSARLRNKTPPQTTLTPETVEQEFQPCAATASFFLYAQRNTILVLHHDTLAIERRFDLHREDVLWIVVDNTSERGSGRLAVSYDSGNTAIVWDILTGAEVARFSAYERMKVASFMRSGNIAFGNDQGNIILFEPSTSEHISARTIFDPITAIAPAADCRTFAIGYLNGSILIATLQPSFTILHTLTTTRAPSRITGLAWHGSSSKQKTDMLATQTMDGDLRVWSVPKAPHQDSPNIIRLLQRSEIQQSGPCWFSWSKNGRIVQFAEKETRAWDVRTKKVTYETVPTIDGTVGIAVYGPTATLFTVGRNHTVQQYDISPSSEPMQVASAQHVPSNTPPTPPTLLDDRKISTRSTELHQLPIYQPDSETSADEEGVMSPLQKIALEMDTIEALERRDLVMPLSPTSSHASSISSRSSGAGRKGRRYLYDRPDSSRASTSTGFEGTEFSFGGTASVRKGHDSMSIRSVSSYQSRSAQRSSNLRREILRSPEDEKGTAIRDLFPFTKARLRDVTFRTPHYGNSQRTPELLQREMLSVVFGWNEDAKSLVHDEMTRHGSRSACGVLLSKWLGDIAADDLTSMIGSQSMTSSDWMLLALSSIGAGSQRKVGEAFVQRLLEKGDVHPAVAILLGLGENNDAVEVYVSQGFWLEAVILTCLKFSAEWGRLSTLLRRWGEASVQQGQAELAVRVFSCTSIETSEPWFSPRAQDAFYFAQQAALTGAEPPLSAGVLNSPPLSPPSRSASGRLTAKNASLKLITTFGAKGIAATSQPAGKPTPMVAAATPIAESALSPAGDAPWRVARVPAKNHREPSSARTATPGGFTRRKRLPSISDIERAKQEAAEMSTPMTAAREFAPYSQHERRTSNVSPPASAVPEPMTAVRPGAPDLGSESEGGDGNLPAPSQLMTARLRRNSGPREKSRARAEGLAVQVVATSTYSSLSPAITTGKTEASSVYSSMSGAALMTQNRLHSNPASPSLMSNSKARAIDEYISSVEEARTAARNERTGSRRRTESRRRDGSRAGRASSRLREQSVPRGNDVVYIKPAKRSPSSPIPMSPMEIAHASQSTNVVAEPATTDDEDFYKIASPIDSHKSLSKSLVNAMDRNFQAGSDVATASEKKTKASSSRTGSRARSRTARDRERSPSDEDQSRVDRGRAARRKDGSTARSPSSPLPMPQGASGSGEEQLEARSGSRTQTFRMRSQSATRKPGEDLQSRRAARVDRDRSASRHPPLPKTDELGTASNLSVGQLSSEISSSSVSETRPRFRGLSRKELAARELEERRLSLARRPSAPAIPLPGELPYGVGRPKMSPRSQTDLSNNPLSYDLVRSQTADPESSGRHNVRHRKHASSGGSGHQQLPALGLPATPRAMRHPRYMGASDQYDASNAPPVPEISGVYSELSSLGSSLTSSSLSQVTGSNISQYSSIVSRELNETDDDVGPLLPSTVFGQKGPQAPPRSFSAPPENNPGSTAVHPAYKAGIPSSNSASRRLSHVRKISPPEVSNLSPSGVGQGQRISSIDEALYPSEPQIIIIPGTGTETSADDGSPILLPELQHLAGPPPPPPPPAMFQKSENSALFFSNNFGSHTGSDLDATDMTLPTTTFSQQQSLPHALERATTASPTTHRHGQHSIDGSSLSARFKGVTDRMRSNSRSRAISPPQDYKQSPYESIILPGVSMQGHGRRESLSRNANPQQYAAGHTRRESFSRAKSPYELAMAEQLPPPPPPPPAPPANGIESRLQETTIPPPPSHLPPRSQSATSGYRNPKEIRANMPPETLQQGVYSGGGFL